MKIKWYGHSCFLLTSESGVRVLTDPYAPSVGYGLPQMDADIVTISHGHYDHNNIKVVRGNCTSVSKPGKFSKDGIDITGIAVFHDESGGSERGGNIIFNIGIDGLNVCHCGDLGHVLTDEQADKIGRVDILLVPVGGVYTIDASGAVEVMKQLKPVATVPMHYSTEALSSQLARALDKADKFVAASGQKARQLRELAVDRDTLHNYSGINILDYSR